MNFIKVYKDKDNIICYINMNKVKKIYYDESVERVRIFFDGEDTVGEVFYLNDDLKLQFQRFWNLF